MDEIKELRAATLLLLVALGVLSSLIAMVFGDQSWDAALLNFGTEMAGAVLTYSLLELLVERRERYASKKSALTARKKQLIARMGSSVQDVAIPAAEELRRRGWLCDGSLEGAILVKANLPGTDLSNADLRGTNLRESNLRGANLRGAYLCEASLSKADLRDADVGEADLKGVDLSYANLDGVRGLTQGQLSEAFSLLGTTKESREYYERTTAHWGRWGGGGDELG